LNAHCARQYSGGHACSSALTGCFALVGAVTLGAQSSTTKTQTKVEVKEGKDVKVTGCVESDPTGGFLLTHVADKDGALHSYTLVSDSDEFPKLVGKRVQIEGKIADSQNGKVEINSKTEVAGAKDTRAKIEGSGSFLGVKNVKTIAAVCP